MAEDAARVPELLPIRYARMALSPFSFFRGSAAVMAADLTGTPVSGPEVGRAPVQLRVLASPERRLVLDVNDFDETLPGPWEWDVKRLARGLAKARTRDDLGHPRRVRLERRARRNMSSTAATVLVIRRVR
jgi:uncharacterized protein (DUF2252 family)